MYILLMNLKRAMNRTGAAILGAAVSGALVARGQGIKKKPAFEVVSIRPTAGNVMKGFRWAPTPDGYRTEGQSIWSTIMIAYFPQGVRYWRAERLIGAPKWALDEFYDIKGKVVPEDLTKWQKQTPTQHEMLNAMLRTMLEERCKLVLRQTMVDAPALALQVAHAGKLRVSVLGATLPAGVEFADGGVMVPYKRGEEPKLSFYGATLADLAETLSGTGSDRIVLGRTGLTGRYDFVLRRRDTEGDAANDQDQVLLYDLDALGLTLKAARAPTVVLVIARIERPSAN